jgi:hypothetical protein
MYLYSFAIQHRRRTQLHGGGRRIWIGKISSRHAFPMQRAATLRCGIFRSTREAWQWNQKLQVPTALASRNPLALLIFSLSICKALHGHSSRFLGLLRIGSFLEGCIVEGADSGPLLLTPWASWATCRDIAQEWAITRKRDESSNLSVDLGNTLLLRYCESSTTFFSRSKPPRRDQNINPNAHS